MFIKKSLKNEISTLTDLMEKKSDLLVEIERLKAQITSKNETISELDEKIANMKKLLTLDEAIKKMTETLVNLQNSIDREQIAIQKLREEHKITKEYIELKKDTDELQLNLSESIEKNFIKIFSVYPNVKPVHFNVLEALNNPSRLNTLETIMVAIDAQLTHFALSHHLKPETYKQIMFDYNKNWVALYDSYVDKYESLSITNTQNFSLFNDFIVLVDE